MATKIFGKSFYEESLIVRCACKTCLMEIFIYDGPEQYEYGIEWLNPCKPIKSKSLQTFYFKDYHHFEEFVDNLHSIANSSDGWFIMESTLRNSIGFVFDGILKVEKDEEDGCIDFIRYSEVKRKKKKLLWDLHICKKDFKAFLKSIDYLFKKATDLECKRLKKWVN